MAITIHDRFEQKLEENIDVWIKGRVIGHEDIWHPGKIWLVTPARKFPSQHQASQAPQGGNPAHPEIMDGLKTLHAKGHEQNQPADGTQYDYKIKFDDNYRTDYDLYYYNDLWDGKDADQRYNRAELIAVETHGPFNRLDYGTLQDRSVDVISMVGAGKVVYEGLSQSVTKAQAAMGLNIFGAVWAIPMVIVGGTQIIESRNEAVYRGNWDTKSLKYSGMANLVSGLAAYLAAASDQMLEHDQFWAKFFTALSVGTWSIAQFIEFFDSLRKMHKIYQREGNAMRAVKSEAFLNACRTLCTAAGGVMFVYSVLTNAASAPALASAGFIGALTQAVGALGGAGMEVIKRKPEPPLPVGFV